MDSYIICSTPRTGSTLLCDLLSSTGIAGQPDSFFMQNPDPIWVAEWGLPKSGDVEDPEYCVAFINAALKAGRGETKIFGLRLMWESLKPLMNLIDGTYPELTSDRARLRAAFGETLFIHLTREDKLDQAISMVRAEQTGLWHIAPDGTEVERLSQPEEPEYNFERISANRVELEQHDQHWEKWFATQDIKPLRIRYENLSANPLAIVECICQNLDAGKPSPDDLEPGVAKMADSTSLEWKRRFQRDAFSHAIAD
ncbi:MAG: Stf0 family sulfotransferase [Pseudomonadota bacterium]